MHPHDGWLDGRQAGWVGGWVGGHMNITAPNLTALHHIACTQVRADSPAMMSVSKHLQIDKFPTVVLLRVTSEVSDLGSCELKQHRIIGAERLSERLSKTISEAVTDDDRVAFEAWQDCERESAGISAEAENVQADEELEWIWYDETAGRSLDAMLDVEEQGLKIVLKSEDDADEKSVWEWFDSDVDKWVEFEKARTHARTHVLACASYT